MDVWRQLFDETRSRSVPWRGVDKAECGAIWRPKVGVDGRSTRATGSGCKQSNDGRGC